MKVAIHQPQYWPWPRYINKLMSADIFVYLDTVQFSKNGFQNRNRIKTAQGALWLTLPTRHRFGQRILETKIPDSRTLPKHFRTLEAHYARTCGYRRWRDELDVLLQMRSDSLCEIAIASTEWILKKLGIETHRRRASELPDAQGKGSALVASICGSLKATSYLTGSGALGYMEPNEFSNIGCEILVQEWEPFKYEQAYPEIGFVPNLSALDLLLNCPDTAGELVRSAGAWRLLNSVP